MILNDEVKLNIIKKIKEHITYSNELTISCRAAHIISKQLKVEPLLVGITIDFMKLKINKCQLGLFGHKKKIEPLRDISQKLKSAINKNNERLSCEKAWAISKELNIKKSIVSSACENIGMKISKCKLGAF